MTYQKNWCFTLNNFTTEEFEKFKSLKDNGDVKYIIFQHECGDSGTNHLQVMYNLQAKSECRISNRSIVGHTGNQPEELQSRTEITVASNLELQDHGNSENQHVREKGMTLKSLWKP